jgi:beta-glucosidase
MKQILKGEWNFAGFITSDFGAVHSTVPSALAGLDLEMPTGKYWSDALKQAVESGQVPMSVIDDKLIRRFRTMMEFHLFDHAPTPKPIPQQADGDKSRQIAEAGMVLLKNEGHLLPLERHRLKSIALIGPYATRAVTGGGGSSHVVPL